ncbi:zinc ribbon domain-containing protein [Streptomyces sviceus]|uniref:zinc ribbon domain-containing protein n=1 Tax=Streptomyces sviceus TaxID=285530 RepID=UPI00018033F0
MLEYKAQRYGRALVKTGRFEPTSQTCSLCGTVDDPKPLHIRDSDLHGIRSGTARRNRKTRIPHRKPRRVAARQPVGKAGILAFQGGEHVT